VVPFEDGSPGSVAAPAAAGHTMAATASVTLAILSRRVHVGVLRCFVWPMDLPDRRMARPAKSRTTAAGQ
jgi:hypothetical protein